MILVIESLRSPCLVGNALGEPDGSLTFTPLNLALTLNDIFRYLFFGTCLPSFRRWDEQEIRHPKRLSVQLVSCSVYTACVGTIPLPIDCGNGNGEENCGFLTFCLFL